jgi:hypothetical protein
MNIFTHAKNYIDQIGGQYTQYDSNKAVIVVPLTGSRFQTILLNTEQGKTSGNPRAMLTSKVCEYSQSIDLKSLLEQTTDFDYSRFIISDGFIKVEAWCSPDSVSEVEIKSLLQEVAQLADTFELKLTGKDVN